MKNLQPGRRENVCARERSMKPEVHTFFNQVLQAERAGLRRAPDG